MRHQLPVAETIRLSPRDCRRKAEQLLEEFAVATGSAMPPVPVEEIAAWRGYKVIPLRAVHDSISALVHLETMLIGVNVRHHPSRQRFSVAHELGHVVLHGSLVRRAADEVMDQEADIFAAELLVPVSLLRPSIQRFGGDVERLAEVFSVSSSVMSRRLEMIAREEEEQVIGRKVGTR